MSCCSSSSVQENIQVSVRVRPLNEREQQYEQQQECLFVDDKNISLNGGLAFTFDHVFAQNSTNEHVYQAQASSVVQSVLSGFNGTIFAYGQTSSGKTHTMQGSELNKGIIYRAVEEIFAYIRQCPQREFLLRISYIEIYNEVIKDLLEPESDNLKINLDASGDPYVGQLKERLVVSPSEIFHWMEEGQKLRTIGKTDMNEYSSRSHSIFRIVIESRERCENDEEDGDGAILAATLTLVDLAGSERIKHTNASGNRLKEGGHINKSLMTLGTVINKLCQESAHIPYRDSKLTHILQPSLGGNARTAIICTVTPAGVHAEETHSTLKFASRAKNIRNEVKLNEILDERTVINRLKREISTLKRKLGENGEVEERKSGIEEFDLLAEKQRRMQEYERQLEEFKKAFVTSAFLSGSGGKKKSSSRRKTVLGSTFQQNVDYLQRHSDWRPSSISIFSDPSSGFNWEDSSSATASAKKSSPSMDQNRLLENSNNSETALRQQLDEKDEEITTLKLELSNQASEAQEQEQLVKTLRERLIRDVAEFKRLHVKLAELCETEKSSRLVCDQFTQQIWQRNQQFQNRQKWSCIFQQLLQYHSVVSENVVESFTCRLKEEQATQTRLQETLLKTKQTLETDQNLSRQRSEELALLSQERAKLLLRVEQLQESLQLRENELSQAKESLSMSEKVREQVKTCSDSQELHQTIDELTMDKAHLQKSLESAQNQILSLSRSRSELQQSIGDLSKNAVLLEETLSQLEMAREELAQMTVVKAELTSRCFQAEQSSSQFSQEIVFLKSSVSELTEQLKSVQLSLTESSQESEILRKQLETAQIQHDQEKEKLTSGFDQQLAEAHLSLFNEKSEIASELEALSVKHQDLCRAHQELLEEVNSQRTRSSTSSKTEEDLQETVRRLTNESQRMQVELGGARELSKQLTKEKYEVCRQVEKLRDELKALEDSSKHVGERSGKLGRDVQVLQEERLELKSQLARLVDMNERLEYSCKLLQEEKDKESKQKSRVEERLAGVDEEMKLVRLQSEEIAKEREQRYGKRVSELEQLLKGKEEEIVQLRREMEEAENRVPFAVDRQKKQRIIIKQMKAYAQTKNKALLEQLSAYERVLQEHGISPPG